MKVADTVVPVETLITTIKEAVKLAGVSHWFDPHGLRVESVQLVLQALASGPQGVDETFGSPSSG